MNMKLVSSDDVCWSLKVNPDILVVYWSSAVIEINEPLAIPLVIVVESFPAPMSWMPFPVIVNPEFHVAWHAGTATVSPSFAELTAACTSAWEQLWEFIVAAAAKLMAKTSIDKNNTPFSRIYPSLLFRI
jgi:hypothetical protein